MWAGRNKVANAVFFYCGPRLVQFSLRNCLPSTHFGLFVVIGRHVCCVSWTASTVLLCVCAHLLAFRSVLVCMCAFVGCVVVMVSHKEFAYFFLCMYACPRCSRCLVFIMHVFVSNFLSHTAQFSTGRKVWKRMCVLNNVVRFRTEHGQSLWQTAGILFSYRVPFRRGLAVRSPCRPCMSLCIRVDCIQQRRPARGSSSVDARRRDSNAGLLPLQPVWYPARSQDPLMGWLQRTWAFHA